MVKETLDDEWEKLMLELTSSRAEVDRVLQCLKEQVRKYGRSENNSQKWHINNERAGLFDGMEWHR